MTTDSELLRQFAKTNSQDTFAELARRHVNLVYSAALRQVNNDAHLAQDVAQMVFIDLARKASSLAHRENLTGWIYSATHFAAAKIIRGENRRRDREEKFMRESENSGTGILPVQSDGENDWQKIRPALDDAMHELKESDRDAILFRYFENRSFVEVGAKLNLNENAARMRVERALEKLRKIFLQRGVATTSALAFAISANAIQLAPTGLAAILTTNSIATIGTGTTLMKIITATKIKLALSAIVIAGAATAFVVQQQNQTKLRGENESLRRQIAQLQTDNENFSNQLANVGDAKKLPDEQFNELLKLRGEVGVLRNQLGELEKLRAENAQIRKDLADETHILQSLPSPEQALFNKHSIQAMNDEKMIGLAMRIWAGDNNDQYPTNFDSMTNELGGITNAINFKQKYELMHIGTATYHYPKMLVLREIAPRQSPADGQWERVYGFGDGSVQKVTSSNGNFDTWEDSLQKEQFNTIYNSPPNQ